MEVTNDSYLLSESELETKVNLNPNEILLIADLDLSQLYSKNGGTTLLKDLPFLRFLFGDNQNTDESKRMMIFLTATPTLEGVDQK
jgi:type IV pilus assembly protein PilQ